MMMSLIFKSLIAACSLAMFLFLFGFVLMELHWGWFAHAVYQFASKLLLLSMLLLVGLAGLGLVVRIHQTLIQYFSEEAKALRQVWKLQTKQANFAQRTDLEWQQFYYLNHFKRQRLLLANNRKHLRELFHAINRELQSVKSQMPSAKYRTLKKNLRRSHRRGDAAAMLSVRGDLSCQ